MKKKIIFISITVLLLAAIVYSADYLALFKSPVTSSSDPVQHPRLADDSGMHPAKYELTSVAEGLYVPWSIVFTSPERLLVSERNGAIRIIEKGALLEEPLIRFPEVSHSGEEGLMGLALDPDYLSTKRVFACLAYSHNGVHDKVISFTDSGNAVTDIVTLIDGIPAADNHAGCRLFFMPDKTLLITTGDATNRQQAQDKDSLGGKILRINRDGSIPKDNPFGTAVWTIGHRNPQGLALDTVHSVLWETEHGPSVFDGPAGGDEVNLIEAGKNYGWPIIDHKENKAGLESPHLEFTPAVAPASLLFYTGAVLPQFTNSLLFGALKGEGLFHLTIDLKNPERISAFEKLADISVGRIRDVIQGPDGAIYFTTSNRDGRGTVRSGDDKIYRLAPSTD